MEVFQLLFVIKKYQGKFYHTAIRLAMLHRTECWVVKGQALGSMVLWVLGLTLFKDMAIIAFIRA